MGSRDCYDDEVNKEECDVFFYLNKTVETLGFYDLIWYDICEYWSDSIYHYINQQIFMSFGTFYPSLNNMTCF